MSNLMLASFTLLIAELIDAQNPPLNAAANVGDRVVINCSTGASVIPGWRYSPTGSVPYTSISYVTICNSLIPSRFVVEPAGNTGCSLIIPSATTEDALVYQCDDGGSFQYFMLLTIIESVEVQPNSSAKEPCKGDPLNITCSVNYSAVLTSGLQMFPSIMWTDLSSNANISGSTPSPMPPNVTTSYLSITVTPPNVTSYMCNVYFNTPNFPDKFAKNAPNYYNSTPTTPLKVQYLSEWRNITSNITSPCVNETALLTCEANGHPEPTYRWINADTNDIMSNTKEVIINSGGNYVCVINSMACNSKTPLYVPCNSATICATCIPGNSEDASAALLLLLILLLLVFVLPACVFLLCYGCSKSSRENVNKEFPWIEKALPCMNGKGCECSGGMVLFIFFLVVCGIVFVPYVLIASHCCRKNSKTSHESRYADNSHDFDANRHPKPSNYEGLKRNPQTIQVYEGLSRRPEYANATGIDGFVGSSTLEMNNHQQTQSHYEELQINQQETTVAYQELVR